ncbi:MAG TPA: HAMP domain-containing sensor histidine kinase [Verrucomicrobiales bacterium]|nr:HAMP domain-containing sensor histidine kinase [Verrucomicrobiales bacterium]
MKASLPVLTFALILFTAAAILAGGILLARRTETIHLPRDREPLHAFGNSFGSELARLERLYESHLRRLAQLSPLSDTFAIRSACDEIRGVQQYSILQRQARPGSSSHIAIPGNQDGNAPLPVPAFDPEAAPLNRQVLLLSPEALLDDPERDSGWIDEPGKPPLFWLRRSRDTAVVILVGRDAVTEAVNTHLATWLPDALPQVRAGAGQEVLTGPKGNPLAAARPPAGGLPVPNGTPDLVVPLPSRFGVWQLASWDPIQTRTRYDAAVLTGSSALALLVALLAAAVFWSQKRAISLTEQRVSFVNRVSHELRSPLTNILLNADLARESLNGSAPRAAARLDLLREEAQRLNRLITNVLTFSKYEQGRLQIRAQPCVPADVITAVLHQFAPSLERRHISVELNLTDHEPARLDADALTQIAANLVSNVEKYAFAGGYLGLTLTRDLDQNTIVLAVRDHGPGIAPKHRNHVFRPFQRLDDRVNAGVSGTGLGLSIARDLAEKMGGSLSLVPAARGAAFELRLPIPSASANE